MRALLARLGYRMSTGKEDLSVRNPLWFVSRVNNGFFFTGYVPRIGGKSRFRFPFGAPLLIGWETRLESGFSTYTFGRSYHEECRVFIEQEADTVVSCKEEASRNMDVRRRIRVSGLENATVRFYREADAMDCPVSIGEHTGGFARGRPDDVDYELEAGGRQLVARGVSGGIIFTW